MSIPKTCKAQVFEKAGGSLVLKDVPVNEPKQGEILIKVIACGVCHSDALIGTGAFGDVFPRIPGHEMIGDVVAVGPGENRWKVGDRVGGGWHGGHDNSCHQCQVGDFQMCANGAVNGLSKEGGCNNTDAEYCTLRTESVLSVPSDLAPAKIAPLLCAGVTVFNGIRQMNIRAGSTVAIQGLGGLGHLGVQYARKLGYHTVALSRDDTKRDFATKLGANDYIDGSKEEHGEALQKMGGAALIVVTAPSPSGVASLINGLAPRGKLLILAPVGDVPFNTVTMLVKGLSVNGWPSGHALDSEEAIRFAQHQDVQCMCEEFPFEKANEAIAHMMEGKVRFRGVLVM